VSGNPGYSEVLKIVAAWPPEQRESLLHALIARFPDRAEQQRPRPTVDELIGIAKGGNAAPTDSEVDQWIDEARTRKYER
jgi:hypothetical protein